MKKLQVIQDKPDEFSFQSLAEFARPIYMDNNATTQIDDDAANEMFRVLEKDYANPSGIHEAGKIARKSVENARQDVANFIGCLPEEVVFTSGGTESINTVINSVMKTNYPRRHFITCLTEHGATLNKLKDIEEKWGPKYEVSYLDVDQDGYFSINQLESFLLKRPHMNLLTTLMAANNETGTIHKDIDKAIERSHSHGALFHIDAVQIAGKLDLKPYIAAGTDFLTISGHKFHAPKGIGVLYVKKGTPFYPIIFGGSQENNYRAGTENVPGIVALGAIARKAPHVSDNVINLTQIFIQLLKEKIPSCIINGGGVPGTINVGFKYVHREAMVVKLSQYGLYVSVGSACAKGIEVSHVLKAMNVSKEYIHGSVRFSFSKYTTKEEVERAIDIIVKSYTEIRNISLGIIE